MLRGLTTVTLTADDVGHACVWYAQVLGIEPYFRRPEDGVPQYVEFRLGDDQDELGIMSRRFLPEGHAASGGAFVYWHVDDVAAVHERLLDLGATPYQPITERGPGFVTAAVLDPYGNVLAIMHNAHWAQRHPRTAPRRTSSG